jgi:hypothetical protein
LIILGALEVNEEDPEIQRQIEASIQRYGTSTAFHLLRLAPSSLGVLFLASFLPLLFFLPSLSLRLLDPFDIDPILPFPSPLPLLSPLLSPLPSPLSSPLLSFLL